MTTRLGATFISASFAGVVSAGGILTVEPANRSILVHNRGGLDWERPVFGKFGMFSSGMFGLLPVYARANGFGFEVLDQDGITADDLNETQILVLINSPHLWSAAETISLEELFYDVHRELISLSTLVDSPQVVDHFQHPETAAALQTQLRQLFASVWEDRWLKSPRKTIPKSTQPKKPINGGHTSIYRIQRTAKQNAAKHV